MSALGERTPEDEAVVAAQLGRAPRGHWGVATRCHLGVPMVIENHPKLDDDSLFPTLYWLTCPLLVKRVATLEAEGAMTVLNDKLATDPDLRERVEAATARLRARRDGHATIEDSGSPPGGGADRIKCLHAHTAQELALPPDPVGALTLAATGFPDCRVPCYSTPDSESPETGI